MKRFNKFEQMWGLGLKRAMQDDILTASQHKYKLSNWSVKNFPTTEDLEREHPFMIWLSWGTWQRMSKKRRELLLSWDSCRLALILEEDPGEELDRLLEIGEIDAVKAPLQSVDVKAVIDRSVETGSLYDDIYRMTQEIYLERELLARKNDYLSFINRFLTRATESLDISVILNNAREELKAIFPVISMQGAVWEVKESGVVEAELFLSGTQEHRELRQDWSDMLLDKAMKLTGAPRKEFNVTETDINAEQATINKIPEAHHLITLPLIAGKMTFGCLIIAMKEKINLGRDQVDILQSALRHLGLAIRNASLFAQVKNRADRDGLTKLYNRKHFDERLEQELARHQRFAEKLSLVLLDIDHFKSINDRYGHPVGDKVIVKLAKTIEQTIRNTDYAARYGGEEFVIILPHTDESQAWILAERLRLAIAKSTVPFDDGELKITTSLGVATMQPQALISQCELITQADKALYEAKQNGRNVVVISRPEDMQEAMVN